MAYEKREGGGKRGVKQSYEREQRDNTKDSNRKRYKIKIKIKRSDGKIEEGKRVMAKASARKRV